MSAQKILIIDDTVANIQLLTDTLEPLGYEILTASNADTGLKIATRALPDLILLDIVMPGRDGFQVCQVLKEHDGTKSTPVLFITARSDTASLVRGFAAGGVDYILKPFQSQEVVSRVESHLKISRLTRELQHNNEKLEQEIAQRRQAQAAQKLADERLSRIAAKESQRWGLEGFVGESQKLKKILLEIAQLGEFGKTSVLITGESGTGKELVARAIHHGSPRSTGPFVALNCAAVPAELAESTLFGHVRGAFTGATGDRKGYFELADGGTLFLDEIGDMPQLLQTKLLRVLEDGELTPVGSGQSRRVDVRVVAATNVDVHAKVASGTFRQDLYFRLARYTIETPPLRQRPEDIGLLASHFLQFFAAEMGRTAPALLPRARALLETYGFPGNVRELKNIVERALILSGGAPIDVMHLQLPHTHAAKPQTTPNAKLPDLPLNLEAAEQVLIQRALEQTGGNVAEAARLLGVNRSRIYRRFPQPET